MLSASRGPSKGPCSPGKPFPTRSSPAWPSSRNFLALSRHLEAWTTRCRGRADLATLHGCPGAPAKGSRGFSSLVLVFLRIYCSVPTPCDLVHMLPRPRCLGDPAWVPWGPAKGPRGICSPVLVFLRIYCSVPTPCGLVHMLPRPSCAGDPAWVPWGPHKGAMRVLQPCAWVPVHLVLCLADSRRPESRCPAAALCRLAAAAVLGPCQCASAESTALRACVPSPLVLCPDSRRPESRCPTAALCRLAAAAILGPCQWVSAGSTALRACSLASSALSRLQAT